MKSKFRFSFDFGSVIIFLLFVALGLFSCGFTFHCLDLMFKIESSCSEYVTVEAKRCVSYTYPNELVRDFLESEPSCYLTFAGHEEHRVNPSLYDELSVGDTLEVVTHNVRSFRGLEYSYFEVRYN